MKNIMIWIMLLLSITYTDAQNGKSPRKDYAKLANYDESKVPQYTLPSVLMCHDGEMVQTKEQWEQKRRPEILNLFTTYMFGKAPVLKHKLPCTVSRINEKALNGRATRKEITIQLTDDPQGPHIDLQLYLPNHVSGKIPVFLGISFMPNYTIYDDPDLSVPEITDEKMKKRSFRGSMDKSWHTDMVWPLSVIMMWIPILTMTSKMVCILIITRKGRISQIRINGVPLQLGHGA